MTGEEQFNTHDTDVLLDVVRCIPSREIIQLSFDLGGYGSSHSRTSMFLLPTGEIAEVYIDSDYEGDDPNTSSVTLGYSLEHFHKPQGLLKQINHAVSISTQLKTEKEKLRDWQIARGFSPRVLSIDPSRFEVPSYLKINPDYTGKFNEILKTAPSLMDKIHEVTNGSRDRIGSSDDFAYSFDSRKGLPELVSTALFIDGNDIYVVTKPQVLPGNLLEGYEWKKKLDIKEISSKSAIIREHYLSSGWLSNWGYPIPYSNSPIDEKDFTTVYDPENGGFPCIYSGFNNIDYHNYEEAKKAALQLGLKEELLSPVFPFPQLVRRNQGLVFLAVGGRYPLGIHRASVLY